MLKVTLSRNTAPVSSCLTRQDSFLSALPSSGSTPPRGAHAFGFGRRALPLGVWTQLGDLSAVCTGGDELRLGLCCAANQLWDPGQMAGSASSRSAPVTSITVFLYRQGCLESAGPKQSAHTSCPGTRPAAAPGPGCACAPSAVLPPSLL